MSEAVQLLTENVSAISALLHTDDRFDELYMAAFSNKDGFTGIWIMCAQVGADFTDVAIQEGQIAGVTYEWMDSIHNFVLRIYECCLFGDGPETTNWKSEASAVIRAHMST